MKRVSSLMSFAVTLAVASAGFAVPSALGAAGAGSHDSAPPTTTATGHWVDTWGSMPQLTEPGNMPPAPFTQSNRVLDNSTLRQTVHVALGGQHIRLRFSNAFGGTDLPLTAVSVARPAGGKAGVGAIEAGSSLAVTFGGQPGIDIPMGAQALSDPLDFAVTPGENLAVTLYLAHGQASTSITSHPGSRTTSYLLAGAHLNDTDLPAATTAEHWYFLSGVDVWAQPGTSVAIMLGDSLTDGRGSTTNMNDRWPDLLQNRLRSGSTTGGVAVINEAAGGNRVLNDGLGPNALARLDRDVLAHSGVSWLLVFEGVNDIGTAAATNAAMSKVTSDLIGAYEQIIARAHAQGIGVFGATITPFGGNAYDDPSGIREAARQAVNQWIRTSHQFDAVIDFDKAAGDPQNPRRLAPANDSGDHLHLTPVGYQALADSVPSTLFSKVPVPAGF